MKSEEKNDVDDGRTPPLPPLTAQQIDTYLQDGVLVIDNLLSPRELLDAREGLALTLMEEHGVDVNDLEGTGQNLAGASSTNGAGGVLDIFYPEWKEKIATNEKLFRMTCQLWKEAYCHSGESFDALKNSSPEDISFKWHPFGAFDCNKGYMYVDRIGFRIATKLSESLGRKVAAKENEPGVTRAQQVASSKGSKTRKKKSRPRPIQRSLTPHFDCCPETYDELTGKNKWRPIQCFVSLADNLHANTGGFEAAPGFHREFRSWAQSGRRISNDLPDDSSRRSTQTHPRPCVGEYTHLSPSHDSDLMRRVQHIPVGAGSAVFWDNRIPHANSYRNDPLPSTGREMDAFCGSARAVVYCSFLPDVELNRRFVRAQLEDWKMSRAPRVGDRWTGRSEENKMEKGDSVPPENFENDIKAQKLSELGRRLIGLVDWS